MKHSLRIWLPAIISVLFVFVNIRASAFPGDGRQVLLLSGNDWFIHEATGGGLPEGNGWIPASVPGNIQSDLENQHLLDPITYGDGDPRLAEVCRKDWWYRKKFIAPAGFSGRRNVIVFDGVDYNCEVWLNGKLLGKHAGMFRRFEFDITSVVIPGKENILAVKLDKIPDELFPFIVGADGKNSGAGTDYFFLAGLNKTRQVLKDLKAPTNFAWDWGPAIWTLGIWKDVRIETTGASRIVWAQVTSRLTDAYKNATITVNLDVNTIADSGKGQLKLCIRGNGADEQSTTDIRLEKGNSTVTGKLQLQHPALWWPNGQGAQPLYHVSAILSGENGEILDSVCTRTGIRELTWGEVEGAPANVPQDATKAPGLSRPNLLYVNGRPIRMIGANLQQPDLLQGNIMKRGPRVLQLAHHAGINALRLWGGGVLPEKMFDLADELGLMLIHTFPLANSVPESDDVFVNNLEYTARNIIRQVRNHPSIVEWSGGNEMGWWTGLDHKALNALERSVKEEDGRLFRATNPVQGDRHGGYFYLPSIYNYFNDLAMTEHWGKGPMMRSTEYGVETPANLEVWQRDIPPADQWPIIPELAAEKRVMIRKNIFHAMGEEWWLGKNVITSLFGEPENLEAMVNAGQFIGAEGIRMASDAYRRRGAAIGGMFAWVFNEGWSNGAGSFHVDYDGMPLMNYYFLADAFRPLAISLKYFSITYHKTKGIDTELWITSDLPGPSGNLSWQYTIRTSNGSVVDKGSGHAVVLPRQSIKIKDIHIAPPANLGPLFVELKLTDAALNVQSERVHIFGLAGVGNVFAGLLEDSKTAVPGKAPGIASAAVATNYAYVGNGAKPASASSVSHKESFTAAFINDGKYGNNSAWLADTLQSYFEIDLGQERTIGRFKIGRDRTFERADHPLGALQIQTSADARKWTEVFTHPGIEEMTVYSPGRTVEILTAPSKARYIRVTTGKGAVDEFEAYPPLAAPPATLPVARIEELPPYSIPVKRTRLEATVTTLAAEEGMERLRVSLKNTGKMTALFSKVAPLLDYRNDLLLDNNFIIVPPGETRNILIKAPVKAGSRLSLLQTGWKITSWNADDIIIQPSGGMLFSFGRVDQMSREFDGYDQGKNMAADGKYAVTTSGPRPDPAGIPWIVTKQSALKSIINLPLVAAGKKARLHITTADQSATPAVVSVSINNVPFSMVLPAGMGKQDTLPYHLAYPYTAIIELPEGLLRKGENILKISTQKGWFTWDGCWLVAAD